MPSRLTSRLDGAASAARLLFIKFLYGSPLLMIVYLATRRVTLHKFTLHDIVRTILPEP